MPKLPKDFSKAAIYRIVCRDLEVKDCYVGSTTNLTKRKANHRGACINISNKDHNMPVYQFIRKHGGWVNWDVVLIEAYPCTNKDDLHKRERFYIERLQASLNTRIPAQTPEELMAYYSLYRETHQNVIAARGKAFHEANKERIHAWRHEKIICECGRSITREGLAAHHKSKIHTGLMNALSPDTSILNNVPTVVGSEPIRHDVGGIVVVVPMLEVINLMM